MGRLSKARPAHLSGGAYVRRLTRATAAVATLGLTALVGLQPGSAEAAASLKPRNEEWQFAAWDIETKVWPISRGDGVTVAVLDTGVNAKLPGLRGVVLPGTNARDGGNGDGRTDVDTSNGGHGTGMAELIAGQGQDDGMLGIAPGVKILPVIVDQFPGTMAKAIRYAVDHGAQVINVSQGLPDDPGPSCIAYDHSLQDAVSYAAKKNVVVVASAGNQGNTVNDPMAPANCPGVLAVGAVDHKKVPWVGSERQPYVAVAAPGYGVGTVGKTGHFSRNLSGTSQAAALTSAVAALVRSKFPQMPAREVVQRIINTTVDAGKPGPDNITGTGIVIPIWALTKDVDKNAPNPPYERLDKWLASQDEKPGAASQSAAPGGPTASKKSSSSGLLIGIVAIVIVVLVVLLMRRRRGGGSSDPGAAERPFPGGPQQYQPQPGPYQGPQDPPAGTPPVGRPQDPPPSFGPPTDPGGRWG